LRRTRLLLIYSGHSIQPPITGHINENGFIGQAHNTKLETQKTFETVAAAALSIAIALW
jgi:hypothetical protein